MTNKSIFTKTGLMLALAFAISTAHSFGQSPIIQDQTFGATGSGADVILAPDTGGGSTAPITFAAFDTSTGDTLTGVDLILENVNVSSTLTITNTSSKSETISQIALDGDYIVTDNATPGNTVEVTPNTTHPDIINPAGQVATINLSATAPSQTTTLLLGTNDLSSYESSGPVNIDLTLSSENSYNVHINGNASQQFTSTGAGDVELEYFYTTPVPEPAQTASYLMGFGVLLMMGRMYLKKQGSLLS